ncbi:hypothetical protein GCM10009646_86580 [Streptomyces aureus]
MHMVLLAVELLEFGLEVGADVAHDLLGARQHGVGECLAPILGDEYQVDVKVIDDVASGAYVRIWVPSW